MRTKKMMACGAVTAALAFGTGAGASAGTPWTYDGTFGGDIAYNGCTTAVPSATTTGTWAVILHGTSAKATFDIDVNGQPHVAYTFAGMKQLPVEEPTVFSIRGKTQAGTLTVTLTGASLTYTIAPYDYDGLTCSSVTYPGGL
jgi:hypothetical protein